MLRGGGPGGLRGGDPGVLQAEKPGGIRTGDPDPDRRGQGSSQSTGTSITRGLRGRWRAATPSGRGGGGPGNRGEGNREEQRVVPYRAQGSSSPYRRLGTGEQF